MNTEEDGMNYICTRDKYVWKGRMVFLNKSILDAAMIKTNNRVINSTRQCALEALPDVPSLQTYLLQK